jgi:hypothetical protein
MEFTSTRAIQCVCQQAKAISDQVTLTTQIAKRHGIVVACSNLKQGSILFIEASAAQFKCTLQAIIPIHTDSKLEIAEFTTLSASLAAITSTMSPNVSTKLQQVGDHITLHQPDHYNRCVEIAPAERVATKWFPVTDTRWSHTLDVPGAFFKDALGSAAIIGNDDMLVELVVLVSGRHVLRITNEAGNGPLKKDVFQLAFVFDDSKVLLVVDNTNAPPEDETLLFSGRFNVGLFRKNTDVMLRGGQVMMHISTEHPILAYAIAFTKTLVGNGLMTVLMMTQCDDGCE